MKNYVTQRQVKIAVRWYTRAVVSVAHLTLLLAIGLSVGHSATPTNSPGLANRYLLIVETSKSMQKRGQGILNSVQQLLLGGMGGQVRSGDSLGIWTYNENLYTGQFRLQYWSPETHRATVTRSLSFLRDQKFEKQGHLAQVFPALEQVIKDSPFL